MDVVKFSVYVSAPAHCETSWFYSGGKSQQTTTVVAQGVSKQVRSNSRGFRLCPQCGTNVSMWVWMQLTNSRPPHKPLPSALHLSFVFVTTPPPLPPPPPFPLLPSSHKHFIDYIPTTLNSPCSKNIYKEKTIKQSKQQKTNKANRSQKCFQLKTSICRDETLNNQPNKMAMTPQ